MTSLKLYEYLIPATSFSFKMCSVNNSSFYRDDEGSGSKIWEGNIWIAHKIQVKRGAFFLLNHSNFEGVGLLRIPLIPFFPIYGHQPNLITIQGYMAIWPLFSLKISLSKAPSTLLFFGKNKKLNMILAQKADKGVSCSFPISVVNDCCCISCKSLCYCS